MFSRSSIKVKKIPLIEAGSLLIAQPFWQDEKYKRSVIIILDHNYSESSGIILNKSSNLCVADTLPELEIAPPLYFGGPFDPNIISFIHSDESIPEAVDLGNNLFYGGNYEYLKEMIERRQIKLKKLKFFSGFVKWGAGQLEAEIAENKWWTSEINAHELFDTSVDDLWVYELLANGHIYGILNEFPDPCMS
jgi:putative transcriptional regulator